MDSKKRPSDYQLSEKKQKRVKFQDLPPLNTVVCKLYVDGWGAKGDLGLGDKCITKSPQVLIDKDILYVNAGYAHCAAIDVNDRVCTLLYYFVIFIRSN